MNKTGGVISHLEEEECDICLVQETFLKSTDTGKLQEIRDNGWDILSCPRGDRGGGGIGILFRDGIVLRQCPVKTKFKSFQVQEVLISDRDQPKRLCNVYRPPYTAKSRFTDATFLSEFGDYLSELVMKQGTPIIAGDLNFQMQDKNNFYSRKLLELLDSFDLQQRVPLVPTHQLGGTLDLVMTTRETNLGDITICPNGTTSDHFLVQFGIRVRQDLSNSCMRKSMFREYMDYKSMDMEGFKEDLQKAEFEPGRDPEESIVNFYRWLEGVVERRVPRKRVRTGKKFKPWRDEELRGILRERRSAERYWRKHGTEDAKRRFNDLKKLYGTMDKEKRSDFVKEDLEAAKGDPKKLQRKLQKLLGKVETILPETTNNKNLADDFSEFFSSKVTKIRTQVNEEQQQAGEFVEPGKTCHTTWNEFRDISEEELISLVKSMSSKHCDLDPLPTWLVKECIGDLAPVLRSMVNQSLHQSSVAESLQKALVFPTIKNMYGDREALSNYRPVSNIPFLSKLLEKVVLTQLNDYLDRNALLGKHQSGYRVGHSCETLLASMFDDILGEMDKGNVVALICLDMSAAFDTVDHVKLLEVLQKRFGVDGEPLQWFKSYLSSRSFRVSVGDCLSETLALLCGVPQGSLLGPILFLLYIEAVQDIVEPYGLRIKLYADDSQLYVSLVPTDATGWSEAKVDIEECLAKVKRWMVEQWLKCNEAKTEFILLGKRSSLSKVSFDPIINFGGTEITPSECSGTDGKTLGILLDHNLGLERQVNNVRKQCGLMLRNLWQLHRCFDVSTKIMLIKQLILSRIDYSNILYCGLPGRVLGGLQKLLNACVRFIFNIHGHQDSYTEYFRQCHILPISYRLDFKACLIAYKIVNGTAPCYLQELVPRDENWGASRETRMTSVPDPYRLKHPKMTSINAKSKLRRRRLSVFLPSVWNELPLELRSIPNVDTFKSRLKTHFFVGAFGVGDGEPGAEL